MHTYLVRKDLTQYQHIHPAIDAATGIWSVDLTIPEPGPYRVVTEFEALTPDGNFDDRILGTDFTVAGTYKPSTAEPAALDTATVDGYELSLDGAPKIGGGDLKLKITKNGADVTDLQPYLASFAHITGFREGDLSSVHVHPNEAPTDDDANATGGPVLTLAPMFMEAGTLPAVHPVPDRRRRAPRPDGRRGHLTLRQVLAGPPGGSHFTRHNPASLARSDV